MEDVEVELMWVEAVVAEVVVVGVAAGVDVEEDAEVNDEETSN